MSASLTRLAVLRARLKRYAEAEHARLQRATQATQEDLARTEPPQMVATPGHVLHTYDQTLSLLWRQEAAQRAAQAAGHQRLLHEVTEHKKVEKILSARAKVAASQAARREAQAQEAWLRHRLHARKKGNP